MKTKKQTRGFQIQLAEEQKEIKQEKENSKKATVHGDKQQVYCKSESKNPCTLVSGFGRQNIEHSNCQNPNSTTTQLNLTKPTTPAQKIPPHPTTQTQCQQYLSCYLPDFDGTLKVGSCEHLEQIPTILSNICSIDICPYQEYLSCY